MNIELNRNRTFIALFSGIVGLAYAVFGIITVSDSNSCTRFLCDLGAYLISLPWSKLWDVTGPLENVSWSEKIILGEAGVLLNAIIISLILYFIIKFIVNKLKS